MKGDTKFMFTKDDSLKAVYSDELSAFLEQLGLLNEFNSGKLHCRYCKNNITKDSLYAFVPVGDSVEFCCNQPQCIISLAEEAQK